jgi:DNA-binding beta-propeller fold protein YncE
MNRRAAITHLMLALALAGTATTLSARTGRANLLYVMNNDPGTGQNAVLGYSRNADGTLVDLPGSPFYTSGTGLRNPNEIIGPDDSDQEMILSADKRFMYVVNEGSNSITVFAVRLDGSLVPVNGSPFPSGGKHPSSLALANGFLYVVNKGDGVLPTPAAPNGILGTARATNYAVFQVSADGSLVQVPFATVGAPSGSSPSQIVATPDGQFLFGNNFLSPSANAPDIGVFPYAHSLLLSFQADEDDGSLLSQPAVSLPNISAFSPAGVFRPFLLGLKPHPTQNILYADAVLASALTVWTWDNNGVLSYAKTVPAGSALGQCWTAYDPAAKWLYVATVVQNVIGVFSIADPMNPVFLQNFTLGGPQTALPPNTPEAFGFTTAPANLAVDPTGKFLYVVNHETCSDPLSSSGSFDTTNCAAGNAIHILQIGPDGKLTEPAASPFIFPQSEVLPTSHPKGLIVL